MTTISTKKPKPWLRHKERPARREGVRLEPLPELQLDIYQHQVVLTRRSASGWRSYPVDAGGVAQALSGLPLCSGLLPPDTLGWGVAAGEPFAVRRIAPRKVELPVMVAGQVKTYRLTLPPLVVAGRGADWRLWALNVPDWPSPDAPLCRAPFPNSYTNGGICWGNSDRPPANDFALEKGLACFLGSNFSMHVDNEKSKRYPASVVSLWATLDPDEPYPLDDLQPTNYPLRWLLAGGPWGNV